MQGFKDFLLRGNLVELAVAFIMATTFSAVVTAFTDVMMGFIGKLGNQPDFSSADIADVNVGVFVNAVITFVIVATVLYFFVVTPYQAAKARYFPAEASGPTEAELLTQIRDLLAGKA